MTEFIIMQLKMLMMTFWGYSTSRIWTGLRLVGMD